MEGVDLVGEERQFDSIAEMDQIKQAASDAAKPYAAFYGQLTADGMDVETARALTVIYAQRLILRWGNH